MNEGDVAAADLVVDIIRTRLRDGQLVPGQRLVASELALELGVSRIPVREAIHRLNGEGLIELGRNRSPRIRSISAKDLADMLHLLGALGRLGIRLASARAGRSADPEAARAPILGIMQEVIRAAEEREAFEFNVHVHKLHVVLAESIENHYLKRALDSIHSEYFSRELAPLLRGQHWSGIATNYRQISDLLGKGDGEAAADAFQKHMDWIIGELFGTA